MQTARFTTTRFALVLIACFGITMCSTLQAQKALGIRLGATYSSYKMTGDLDESFDGGGGLGYYGEIDFNLPFGTSGFSIMPLLGFNYQQTAQFSTEATVDNSNFPLALGIIESGRDEMSSIVVAALFRYRFQGKSITPFFEFGPYAKFNIGGNYFIEGHALSELSATQVGYVEIEEEMGIEFGKSSSDHYKPSNFTMAIGTGLQAEFEFGTLSIGLRYIGIGNTRSPESEGGPAGRIQGEFFQDSSLAVDSYSDKDKLKLRTVEFTVGYSFPLGGY